MSLRISLIDEAVLQNIERVVAHAEKNPFSLDDMKEIVAGVKPVPGDSEAFTFYVPDGCKAVFTIELQEQGRTRHLSVSVDEDGKLPNIALVNSIMKLVGMTGNAEDMLYKLEDISPNRQAINVWEIFYAKSPEN
jgi:hypothetical protein